MGTRHLQITINKEGETKLSQYGQWDGYPDGQGVDILEFLSNNNLEEYLKEVNKLREPTDEENKIIDNDEKWATNYPYLSRDCGAKIHKLILENKVKFVGLCSLEEARKWCEGFYTIDFQKNTFTSEFGGKKKTYKLNKLPSKEKYLKDMGKF